MVSLYGHCHKLLAVVALESGAPYLTKEEAINPWRERTFEEMEDSKENHMPTSSTRTAPSGRPGPVENVHFEFWKQSNAATANGSYERVPDGAPNVPADGVVAPLTTSVVGDINSEVNNETRQQQSSQDDRNQFRGILSFVLLLSHSSLSASADNK